MLLEPVKQEERKLDSRVVQAWVSDVEAAVREAVAGYLEYDLPCS